MTTTMTTEMFVMCAPTQNEVQAPAGCGAAPQVTAEKRYTLLDPATGLEIPGYVSHLRWFVEYAALQLAGRGIVAVAAEEVADGEYAWLVEEL